MVNVPEMLPILSTLFLIAFLVFLILLILGRRRLFVHPGFLVIFFLVYFIDNLAITLANQFPGLQIVPNHTWEGFLICGWSGKAYSILAVLLLLYLLRSMLSPGELGLTLHQNQGSFIPSMLVILLITAWSSLIGSRSPKGAPDPLVLAYLALMPGLNEELVYRGVLPACLERIFPSKWSLASARMGWGAIVTTILFGLLHGLWLDEHLLLHANFVWIRNALISGFIFAWLRGRTGSLVMPVIAHGAWDFFLFLFRML